MLEPDVLNTRAWALDAVEEDSGLWQCETVFDGLGGERPVDRDGAAECPKERTRVLCSFDPETGALSPTAPVHVWQERCWSASPAAELDDALSDVDRAWFSSVVGFMNPAPQSGATMGVVGAAAAEGAAVALGGGIKLRGRPGMLEVTLTSGARSRNSYRAVVVRRSWAGVAAGRSVFAEVETVDDTTGDQ